MDLCHLLAELLGVDWGEILLKNGRHCIFIKTECHPTSVWFSVKGHGHHSCCQNPLNFVAYTLSCNGVHFYTDIQSDYAEIKWFSWDDGSRDNCSNKDCHCDEQCC
jgi:hypothetical protein